MRREPLRSRTLASFFLHALAQLCNPRAQAIKQLQQIVPSLTGPGRQPHTLQLLSSPFSPQAFLTADSLIQRHRLQLIHQPRAHLHHPVPVPQQLPQITVLPARHPYPRKTILQHQSQKELRILSIRLLLPYSFGSNLRRIPDPQLELQFRQQALKPSRLSTGFHPYSNPARLFLHSAIELLGFLAMSQSALLQLARFRLYVCDLLEARVIVTSYNQHVRLLSPEPWLVSTTKAYSGLGADIVMESIAQFCAFSSLF